MTLMEQYGTERRSVSFPLCNALFRAATCFLIGFSLTAMIARGAAEKAFANNDSDPMANNDSDPMMERARRELGRALSERARTFEHAERGQVVLSLREVSHYPMPIATMETVQPISQQALNQAAGTLFDPAPLGGGQSKASERHVPVRPSPESPNAIEKLDSLHRLQAVPRADGVQRLVGAGAKTSTSPVTEQVSVGREDQLHSETTGSTTKRAGERRPSHSACPTEAYPRKQKAAVLRGALACVISVRG
jgi:hypothetical protein